MHEHIYPSDIQWMGHFQNDASYAWFKISCISVLLVHNTEAIPLKILQGHSSLIPLPPNKFCPNQSSF